MTKQNLETIRVALEWWGKANCGREDFTECGLPICRDFAEALKEVREELT